MTVRFFETDGMLKNFYVCIILKIEFNQIWLQFKFSVNKLCAKEEQQLKHKIVANSASVRLPNRSKKFRLCWLL